MLEQNTNIFEGGLDERSKAYLLETTRWTKFLAIMGFILIGLMVVGSLFLFAFGASMSSTYSSGMSGFGGLGGYMGIGMGLLYLLIAAFYLFPIISLFKFSTNMKLGINTNNAELITEAFRHQKNLYKFIGILTIIVIVLYLLIIVGAALVGIAGGR